jgi:hypothetical protein
LDLVGLASTPQTATGKVSLPVTSKRIAAIDIYSPRNDDGESASVFQTKLCLLACAAAANLTFTAAQAQDHWCGGV